MAFTAVQYQIRLFHFALQISTYRNQKSCNIDLCWLIVFFKFLVNINTNQELKKKQLTSFVYNKKK